jgi:hypothetical protein
MADPVVPDTIGGKAAKLQKAAAKQDWFTKKAVDRRIKSTEQQQKRKLS